MTPVSCPICHNPSAVEQIRMTHMCMWGVGCGNKECKASFFLRFTKKEAVDAWNFYAENCK